MTYFAGLDVSLEWTSVCVVDGDGQIVREAKVLSEPDALVAFFAELSMDVTRICLEAGPLSQWLYEGLAEAGLPVVCAETRQLKAVLSAAVNKSDRNDARGIAQLVRVDMIRPVHVKTMSSQHRRMLLTNRKFMLKQLCDAEGNIRGTLRNFGLKVGKITRGRFEVRVLDLVADRPALARLVEPMLRARAELLTAFNQLHKMMLDAVRVDPVLPPSDDGPRRRSGDGVDLPGHRRCSGALRALSLGRCSLRANATKMAVWGNRPHGPDFQVRRRDDANGTLRRCPQHAHANDAVVLAEGMGNASGEAARQEAGDGCARPPPRRDHAPNVDGWQRVPLEPRRRGCCGRCLRSEGKRERRHRESPRASAVAEDVPVGTKDEVSSWFPQPQSVDDGQRALNRLFRLVF